VLPELVKQQVERFGGERDVACNAQMSPRLVRKHCVIDEASKALLERAIQKMGLSARAYDRILKVSRTIADLDRKRIHPDTAYFRSNTVSHSRQGNSGFRRRNDLWLRQIRQTSSIGRRYFSE